MQLEFATNKQLIDELCKRSSFVGVVIRCERDLRGNDWDGEEGEFLVTLGGLDTSDLSHVLTEVAGQLQGLGGDIDGPSAARDRA